MPRQMKRLFDQTASLHEPFTVEWNDTEFKSTNDMGNTTIPWEKFRKFKEDETLILLYQSDMMFNMVRKSDFESPEQLEDFRSHLAKIGPAQ